ncbi:hypothetical protein GCM10011505_37130 [Tistrella bauzanensis]|uniref:6-carboxy-5,6,7,8-tetrahydropterin synthase n=1 Tax=Tistrella bauzanensis TaxID=657419 RepID=A0ABQ1IUC4_9PROT|nr:6-carboxytetrahydropterin synthase [Tistrella bauzanensis]GGB52691.1 hypothetical protein GCM10011505_37130 [Tistrella bauzanensis]
MFTLGVRDHVMIAHSFRGEIFGPAQRLHGATYVVDVEFKRSRLDDDGLVVDIGLAHTALKAAIEPLAYRNLDDLPDFAGINTTTEFLAQYLHGRMAAAIEDGRLGASAAGIEAIRIVLKESHVAWAAYEAPVGRAAA